MSTCMHTHVHSYGLPAPLLSEERLWVPQSSDWRCEKLGQGAGGRLPPLSMPHHWGFACHPGSPHAPVYAQNPMSPTLSWHQPQLTAETSACPFKNKNLLPNLWLITRQGPKASLLQKHKNCNKYRQWTFSCPNIYIRPHTQIRFKDIDMWRCICIYKSEFIHGNDGIIMLVYIIRVQVDIKINGEYLFKNVKITKDKERLRTVTDWKRLKRQDNWKEPMILNLVPGL